MTRDDIINLAKEATNKNVLFEFSPQDIKVFERFANLVSEHEREACAKWFDNKEDQPFYGRHVALTIRARGQE